MITDFILRAAANVVADILRNAFPLLTVPTGLVPALTIFMQQFAPYLKVCNTFFPVKETAGLVVAMFALRGAALAWFALLFIYEHMPFIGNGGG